MKTPQAPAPMRRPLPQLVFILLAAGLLLAFTYRNPTNKRNTRRSSYLATDAVPQRVRAAAEAALGTTPDRWKAKRKGEQLRYMAILRDKHQGLILSEEGEPLLLGKQLAAPSAMPLDVRIALASHYPEAQAHRVLQIDNLRSGLRFYSLHLKAPGARIHARYLADGQPLTRQAIRQLALGSGLMARSSQDNPQADSSPWH